MNQTLFAKLLSTDKLYAILIICTIIYLFWQISLCGAILAAQTMEASQRLSELAKLTVGFGTALFTFRSIYKKFRLSIAFIIAFVLGFGAMKTEDFLVNHYAEQTNAQERTEAKAIQLFNEAQVHGVISLDNLPQEIVSEPIKLKAFSKVLGFSIWNNTTLASEIFNKKSTILYALYGQELFNKVDKEYDEYINKYLSNIANITNVKQDLARLNFAELSHSLNAELVRYAACASQKCRDKLNTRVQKYVDRNFPHIPLTFNLQDFCKKTSSTVYVLGKPVAGEAQEVCATSESDLFTYAQEQLSNKIQTKIDDSSIPEHIKSKLLSETMLSLEEWRGVWKEHIDNIMLEREQDEFGNPAQYGDGGSHAEEGKDYAVAIFLPPIALGFSITVSFLHIASLLATATKCVVPSFIAVFSIYLLPALFATSAPLDGFAGIYATWLIFWQGFLFPLGIFKQFIL